MTSTPPYCRKYKKKDFMSDAAKPKIERLIKKYLQRLGLEKARTVSRNKVTHEILTEKMHDVYMNCSDEDKQTRTAWKKWIKATVNTICDNWSDGKDTTAADGMDAPGVVSGAAAHGTGMPAQWQSTELLPNLQQQVDGLRQASQSMDTYMEKCVTRMEESFIYLKDLRDRQVAFDGLISDLEMQLRKAMDAQDVGAPAMTQVPAPASSSTDSVEAAAAGAAPAPLPVAGVVNAALASLPVNRAAGAAGGAQASAAAPGSMAPAPDPESMAPAHAPIKPVRSYSALSSKPSKPRAAGGEMVIDLGPAKIKIDPEAVLNALGHLFSVKYPDMKTNVSSRTKKGHIQAYLRKFVLTNMEQMLQNVEDISKYNTKDLVLQALLWEWQDELKEYMRMQAPAFTPTPEIDAIKMLTTACEAIFGLACDHGKTVWASDKSVQTPLSKMDNFERECAFIQQTFEQVGVKCDKHKTVVKIEASGSWTEHDEGDGCIIITDDEEDNLKTDSDSEEESGGKA